MAKFARSLVVLSLVSCLAATPSFAATTDVVGGMKDKAVRGVINLFTGIVELPVQICKGYRNGFGPIQNEVGSKTVGTILGVFRGLGHAAGRTGWGAHELFGFWSVNPEDNEGNGIPLDAEYAWEEGTQYNIFEPSLKEGIKPYGRKLLRGIANGFLGIAELPGQTIKGMHDGNVLKGLGKGVWYWFSREVYGMGLAYSFLLPNPADNPGVAFDGEWPWTVLSEELDSSK